VTIPGSVTSVGPYAFVDKSLAAVTIGNGVTRIGQYAFYYDPLTSVTLPGSVTNIGTMAFYDCLDLTSVYFNGNAPTVGAGVFRRDPLTIFFLPGTTGWSDFAANNGLTAVLWNPLIQVGDGGLGVRNNQFGFNITGTNNFTFVVAVCTNLAGPVWVPLATNTLVNGSFYFSDPQWTNYSNGYYRLQMP